MEIFDITTLITIAVAVFVLLRLRSVLGQRTGHQEPPKDIFEKNKQSDTQKDDAPGDNVVKLPSRKNREEEQNESPVIQEIDEIAKPRTKLNKGLKEIFAASPEFSPKQFLSGAAMAYEMIVNAYADGDKKTLKNLLSKEVYEEFSAAISDREKSGDVVKSSFVGIDDSAIHQATMIDGESHVAVRFISQIISVTHNKDGEVIDGDESQIASVTDIWTFARDTNSRDPNWRLVATESGT